MEEVTQYDVEKAVVNWCCWRDVFEHTGPAADNPLLVESAKFNRFLQRYSVGRTIRAGMRDELRMGLRSPQFPLEAMLEDTTGKTLDKQELSLRKEFGTHQGRRRLLSALSKIAAFLAPHAFIAWDTDARKGLKVASQRRSFENYFEYMEGMNALLSGELGARVRDACVCNYPSQYAAERDRFHRRVLDRYLMVLGGRDKRPI